jgi:hypothetical protein
MMDENDESESINGEVHSLKSPVVYSIFGRSSNLTFRIFQVGKKVFYFSLLYSIASTSIARCVSSIVTLKMVKGKSGLYLEAWKFGVYISIPIIASVYYSNPDNQRYWADYWQFIKYPENPNTNVKEKIQELIDEKEGQREQRMAYQEQLRQLEKAANRSASFQEEPEKKASPSLWKRGGRWVIGLSKQESE